MGRRLILNCLILGVLFSCAENKSLRIIQECINEVRLEYASDKRTALFDITLENVGALTLNGETNLPLAKAELIRKIEQNQIKIIDKISVLPDKTDDKKYGLINVSVANLRSEPRHSSELVTQATLGTPVHVLKNDKGWYLVQTPDKYIAWTNGGSMVFMDDKELETWKSTPKIIYINTAGFSMNETLTNPVSDLVAGNVLILDHQTEAYWVAIYPDGRTALVSKTEAELLQYWDASLSLLGLSISQAAQKLMGTPYLWGGTSTKGLDCSGFTKTVYFLSGIILPRDASQQVRVGKLIDDEKNFAKLRVGDLLFFGTKNETDQSEKVVHVGLWLGDNQFIHASGDVHISSVDSLSDNFDNYNYDRYLRSKRIIGENVDFLPTIQDVY